MMIKAKAEKKSVEKGERKNCHNRENTRTH